MRLYLWSSELNLDVSLFPNVVDVCVFNDQEFVIKTGDICIDTGKTDLNIDKTFVNLIKILINLGFNFSILSLDLVQLFIHLIKHS